MIFKEDKLIEIPKDVLTNECKIAQGADSCIYGVVGGEGFQCTKHIALRFTLEQKADRKEMVAQARGIECSLHKGCATVCN